MHLQQGYQCEKKMVSKATINNRATSYDQTKCREFTKQNQLLFCWRSQKNRNLNSSAFQHDQQNYEHFLCIESLFLPCMRPQNFDVHRRVPQLWLHLLRFQCNSTRILVDSLQSMLTSAKNHHMSLSVTVKTEILHSHSLKEMIR